MHTQALFWLRQYPDRVHVNRAWLAAAAAYAGLWDEADEHVRAFERTWQLVHDVDEIAGYITVSCLRAGARFRNAADLEHFEQGLAMAGITEAGVGRGGRRHLAH